MEWNLSGKKRRWLRERMRTTQDARACRRCNALLRLCEGQSVSAVAQEFGVSRQTLYNWRSRWREAAAEGLQDQPRCGRPSVWTDERTQVLEQLLAGTPRQYAFHAVGWTAGLLKAGLQQLVDWDVSERALRNKLHDLDYVWKRYRYRLKPDPMREKKKAHHQACP
jgi:transposase